MSEFPTAVPTFTDLNPATTLAANNHAARHNKVHEEVEAIATKVGVNGSADPASLDKKVADLRTDLTDLDATTSTTTEMNAAIAAAIATAKSALYPVGSIYFNANVATNPSDLLGFGTWAAWGSGRVPVGVDSSQTEFDGVEETGGAKTHTLTEAQMPSHGHANRWRAFAPNSTGSLAVNDLGGDAIMVSDNASSGVNGDNIPGNPNVVNNTGGGGAHNNLQPYITVYMWKRTA